MDDMLKLIQQLADLLGWKVGELPERYVPYRVAVLCHDDYPYVYLDCHHGWGEPHLAVELKLAQGWDERARDTKRLRLHPRLKPETMASQIESQLLTIGREVNANLAEAKERRDLRCAESQQVMRDIVEGTGIELPDDPLVEGLTVNLLVKQEKQDCWTTRGWQDLVIDGGNVKADLYFGPKLGKALVGFLMQHGFTVKDVDFKRDSYLEVKPRAEAQLPKDASRLAGRQARDANQLRRSVPDGCNAKAFEHGWDERDAEIKPSPAMAFLRAGFAALPHMSQDHRETAKHDLVRTAIKYNMAFALLDVDRCPAGEGTYALATGNNLSFCRSYEHCHNRPPYIREVVGQASYRLSVGSQFMWGGRWQVTTDRWGKIHGRYEFGALYRVTSFADDGTFLRACPEGSNTPIQITPAELHEQNRILREKLKVAKQEHEDQQRERKSA